MNKKLLIHHSALCVLHFLHPSSLLSSLLHKLSQISIEFLAFLFAYLSDLHADQITFIRLASFQLFVAHGRDPHLDGAVRRLHDDEQGVAFAHQVGIVYAYGRNYQSKAALANIVREAVEFGQANTPRRSHFRLDNQDADGQANAMARRASAVAYEVAQ